MIPAPLPTTLRLATPADAPAITALTEAAYAKYIPLIGRKPQPMTVDYARMAAEHPIWLLYLDNELAGLLALKLEPETLLIYSVAVRPDLQGRGLGRRLLALAEEQALKAGYRQIRLYTNEHFVSNIELYRRVGYQETRREAYLGTHLVHMAKKLGE
jgi:ribosomal protein S18 acetylase RimI-like enzyme